MTDEFTVDEMKQATAMAAQIQAKALDVLMPMTITMEREDWPANVSAIMWRAIANAALDNARKQDASP